MLLVAICLQYQTFGLVYWHRGWPDVNWKHIGIYHWEGRVGSIMEESVYLSACLLSGKQDQ